MTPLSRISKQAMFMKMAQAACERSTCRRKRVGVVITDLMGTSVVSIGYNGNARGFPNTCDSDTPGDCGCIHAEINALLKAPFHQGPLTMYTTLSPCVDCAKLIINSQVKTVFYQEPYRDTSGLNILKHGNIEVWQMVDKLMDPQLELGS